MVKVPFELQGFEPISRIGGGGFGDVWLAKQTNIDREVAIKVGHSPIDDKNVQLRFERECKALGRLSGHPNIIDVFTAGQLEDGRPYLVLEYVNGGTLWQRLQRGPLSEAELVRFGLQLCEALRMAHDAGVLHRDLKPENILLRQNGDAVLGDFGIARLHDGANTTSHAITASVAYAAPEILSGKPASVASDVYGIGICLLAGVLRSVPFVETTDDSIHPIINRVLTDKPPTLGRLGFSASLAETVEQLLEKDPDRRPPSAEAVMKLLERAANPAPAPSFDAPPTEVVADPAPGSTRRIADVVNTGPDAPTAPQPAGFAGGPGAYAPPTGQPSPHSSTGGFPAPTQAPNHPAAVSAPHYAPQSVQAPPTAPPSFASTSSSGSSSGGGFGSDRVRVFGAAFGATLLIGGLLVFAITRFTGGSDDSSSSTTTSSTSTTAEPTTTSSSSSTTTTSTTAIEPIITGPLTLPLSAADANLGENVATETDFIGPNSPQFCDNVPVTAGLQDFEGETYSAEIGFPAVFQEVVRFETAAQASAFVSSYVATVNCDTWTIPADEAAGSPPIDLVAEVVDPVAFYGDDTRQIDFQGQADFITLQAKAIIVRRDLEVYLLSVTSIVQADVDDIDRLIALAVERLGY